MSGMKEPYSYAPIDSADGQIRLLIMKLDINRKFRQANAKPISGTLVNYHLPLSTLTRTRRAFQAARMPPFWALSYVWGSADGDSSKPREILVDGKSLAISGNLHDALDAMHGVAFGEIRVWADAVCIHQADLAERSEQILLMREIYNCALDVKVWLGSLSDDRMRCLRFISDLADPMLDLEMNSADYEESRAYEITTKAIIKGLGPIVQGLHYVAKVAYDVSEVIESPARDDKAQMVLNPDNVLSAHDRTINGVSEWRPSDSRLRKAEKEDFQEIAYLIGRAFMKHEWFSRMWVVQEIGVADTSQFLIGGFELEAKYFHRTLNYLHFVRNIRIEGAEDLLKLTKIGLAWRNRMRQPLRDLIRECRNRKSTDPRDKIYSLYGLMGDTLSDYLQPDYSLLVGQVYANTTRHFLQQYKSLDTICGWQTLGREKDLYWELPSWAPDYTLDQSRVPAPLVSTDGRECIYAASGHDHRSEYELQEGSMKLDWRELSTFGVRVGSVEVLSDPIPYDASFSSIEKVWLSTIRKCMGLIKNLSTADLESLDQISSYVAKYHGWFTSDRTSPRIDGSEEIKKLHYNDIVDAYLKTLLSGRSSTRERTNADFTRGIIHFCSPPPTNQKNQDFFLQVCNALVAGTKGKQFAVTDTGHMCTLPRGARIDDLVCVLYGCSVPVLLRERFDDGTYVFLGECYVDGFMDAEAIAMHIRGDLEGETFDLK